MTQDRFITILTQFLADNNVSEEFISRLNEGLKKHDISPVESIREAVERDIILISNRAVNEAFVWPEENLFDWLILSHEFSELFRSEEEKD